jgi:hypothetical protein
MTHANRQAGIWSSPSLAGYRYALELTGGEAADPVFFNSALPSEAWKAGDEFLAATDLRRFRIVKIGELEVRGYERADGVWIVESA